MSATLHVLAAENEDGPATLPRSLTLTLDLHDATVIAELIQLPEGSPRQEFAAKALRIGVMALQQARGQIDVESIRREGDRLLQTLNERLEKHSQLIHDRTSQTLREYFDPQSGRFQERVERLIRQDGELEQTLRRQLGSDDSELSRTLSAHFGANSQLLQWLNPDQTVGLMGALRGALNEQLLAQREHVLKQFSLDNKEGALCRFIQEITQHNGLMAEQVGNQIDLLVKQFSADEAGSALNRLLENVTRSTRLITSQFSLDDDTSALSRLKRTLELTNSTIQSQLSLDDEESALARLKRELMGLLTEQRDQSSKFQEEVKTTLLTMVARKEEAARSTRHGLEFELAVVDFIHSETQKSGDVLESTGSRVGRIKNCKVGDAVIELGPESTAPGARIVVEAKEVSGYQEKEAREEIDMARKNRDAQVGLFVFSRKTAPTAMEALRRIGNDVFVAWDPEDANTELALKLGVSLARALAVRQELKDQSQSADLQAIDSAVLHLEKATNGFDELQTSANQVTSHGEKMQKRIGLMRKEIERQLEVLHEKIQALQQAPS